MLPMPPDEQRTTFGLRRLWRYAWDSIQNPGLHRDTFFLIAGTMIGAFGGLAYWKIITFRYGTATVGLAATAISAATFLGNFACLGFASSIVRFMPGGTAPAKAALMGFIYRIVLAVSILVGLAFLVGRRWWAPSLLPAQHALAYVIIFIALTVSTSALSLVGGILQAERLMPFLLVEYLVFNIIQVGAGWLMPVQLNETGLLLSYTLPTALVALGFLVAIPFLTHTFRVGHAQPTVSYPDLLRYSLGIHLYSQTWAIPVLLFPLMVLNLLGASASASLAITWYAYNFLSIIPTSYSAALFIDGSYSPSSLGSRLYQAIRANLFVLLPTLLIVIVLAPWLLGFFGPVYASAAGLLRILALSIIPSSISGLYMILLRVRKQIVRLVSLAFVFSAGSTAVCYLLIVVWGLEGLGWGWLASQTIFAVCILPFIVMERRRSVEETLS